MAAPLADLDFTFLTPDEVLALANPPPEYEEVCHSILDLSITLRGYV